MPTPQSAADSIDPNSPVTDAEYVCCKTGPHGTTAARRRRFPDLSPGRRFTGIHKRSDDSDVCAASDTTGGAVRVTGRAGAR